MNWSILALTVVRSKVTRIAVSLIQIGLARRSLPLEFQDEDWATHQKERVAATLLKWEPVFEDGRVVLTSGVGRLNFGHFGLKRRHGISPRSQLRFRCILNEAMKGVAHCFGIG
jgi:hypothetical protein